LDSNQKKQMTSKNENIVNSKRSILAYTIAYALSSLCINVNGHTSKLNSFDFREFINILTPSQLQKMNLSHDKIKCIIDFQNEINSQSFDNYEKLRKWIHIQVKHEYLTQKLVVHERCILSNAELALLVLNFRSA
jgi:hypothetical protein